MAFVLEEFAIEGEDFPYGIISGGTICHGICSLIMTFVCGGGEFYHMALSPPPPRGSSAMGFLPGEGLPYGIISGGGGG